MRRVKWIKQVKVSQALVAALTLLLLLLPLYNYPYWVKYGWSDIPVRGKFTYADMSICRIGPFTLSGVKVPKGFRPFGYVTVIPDTFPNDRLFGYYDGSAAFIPRCYYLKYPNQLGATIIFHPNPYIQALLKGVVGPSP